MAGATRPLEINKLRIARNVQPGDTLWNSTTMALDPRASVVGHGGRLLEADEETQTVYFIYHSILQHLLAIDGPLNSPTHHGVRLHPIANSELHSAPEAIYLCYHSPSG